MITRCFSCGSYFNLRRFPSCPVCGRPGTSVPRGAPAFKPPPSFQPDRDANRDLDMAGWTHPVGIVVGLLGPLVLYRIAGTVTPALVFLTVIMLLVLAVFGAGARAADQPALYAAGRIARTALMTIAIAVAAAAIIGVAILVLLFVACAGGGVF